MLRPLSLMTLATFSLATIGCYNTYVVQPEEFARLQAKPDDSTSVAIKDSEGTDVVVENDTRLYVRSSGGRRYPVTPFNFKMTQAQLVASDRDTLLMLDGVDSYEVDHISTWKTVTLASVGALAAAGVIVAIIATAGEKTY
ncbi:MAG: hypothetical protein IV100_20090 [Myxococcales bacterium]|jgi:hypothetical protein|nr:hypothetical protein [Myxococcales bacterium]